MDGWMGGWVDGWMDGWIAGWIIGWMDRWMSSVGPDRPLGSALLHCIGCLLFQDTALRGVRSSL